MFTPDSMIASINVHSILYGSTTFVPIHDWAHTTVPRHDCAQARLCPDTIVPRHDCAQTHLICAQT